MLETKCEDVLSHGRELRVFTQKSSVADRRRRDWLQKQRTATL